MGFIKFFKPSRTKLIMFALVIYYEIIMQTVRYCTKSVNADVFLCNFIITSSPIRYILGLISLPIHSVPIIIFYPFSKFYFWIFIVLYWWWLISFVNHIHLKLIQYNKYPKDFLEFFGALIKLRFKKAANILFSWVRGFKI